MNETYSLPLKYIPIWSIVRLPDGRVGRLGNRKQYVLDVDGDLGVEIKPDVKLEVIKYPAQLAFEWMEQFNQKETG